MIYTAHSVLEAFRCQDKKKKRKNLSKYITGMDDLLERGIYHKFGEGKNPLKVEKDHVKANRAEFLRSRNQPLKRSINGLDKKLAEVSGYKPFIKNKEVNVKGESVHREFLNISDLDVMAIFRRSSSRWNVVEKIEKSKSDNIGLQNNIPMRQSREAALYGDDIVRYGSVPITAKGQMVQNRRAKIGK